MVIRPLLKLFLHLAKKDTSYVTILIILRKGMRSLTKISINKKKLLWLL